MQRPILVDFVKEDRTDRTLPNAAAWHEGDVPLITIASDEVCGDFFRLFTCCELLGELPNSLIPGLLVDCFQRAEVIETYSQTVVQVLTDEQEFELFVNFLRALMKGEA
jgi:hypothetical protein